MGIGGGALPVGERAPVGSSEAPIQQTTGDEAASERAELLSKIPRIVLGVSGALDDQVELTLDGAVLPLEDVGRQRLISPGRHLYAGQRGSVHREVSFDMSEGEHQDLWLTFEREPVPPRAAGAESST